MGLKNYSIKTCHLSLGGIPISEGLVSFECAPVGDRFDDEVSADGDVCRYDTGEVRHDCTLILKGYSVENQKLSGIHQVDVASENGAGVFVLSFKDEQGATAILTDKAYIKAMAGGTFANKREDTTWKIRAVFDTPLSFTIGGN
jgi:hypothetical protein